MIRPSPGGAGARPRPRPRGRVGGGGPPPPAGLLPPPPALIRAEGLADAWRQQQLQERVLLLQVIFLVLYSGEPADPSLLCRFAAAVNAGLLGLQAAGLPPAAAQLLLAAQRLGCLTVVAGLYVEGALDDLSRDPAATGEEDPHTPAPHPLDAASEALDTEFLGWWGECDGSASATAPAASAGGGRAAVLMIWAAFLRLRQARAGETSASTGALASLAGLDFAAHAQRAQQGGALDELRALLADPLLADAEDGEAFRSVAKNSLAAVLAAFHDVASCYAPPRASVGALDCLALCLAREAPLAEQFWDGGYRPDAPSRALLAGARRLFPAVPVPLLHLLGSACGPADDEAGAGAPDASASQVFTAESAFKYLSALPSVAAVHSAQDIGAPGSPVQVVEEGRGLEEAGGGSGAGLLRVFCTEPLPLPGLPELVLPPGAQGVVRNAAWVAQWAQLGLFSAVTAPLAEADSVLVEWDVPADGFYLTLRLLAGECPRLGGAGRDGVTTPRFLRVALTFVARTLSACPTLAPEMLAVRAHLPGRAGSGGAGLVDVVESILSRSLASRSPPVDLVATAFGVCRSISVHAPSEVAAVVIGALGTVPEALEDVSMPGADDFLMAGSGGGAARPPPGLERLREAESSDARQRRSESYRSAGESGGPSAVVPIQGGASGVGGGDLCPWDAETELALCLASLLRRGAAEAVGPAGRQLMAALASHGLPPPMAGGLLGRAVASAVDVRASVARWGRASACFEVLCAALTAEAGLVSGRGEVMSGHETRTNGSVVEPEGPAEKAWKQAAACCSGQALQHMHRVLGRPGLAAGPGGLGLPSTPTDLAGLPPSAAGAAERAALALLRTVPVALSRVRAGHQPRYGEVGGISAAAVGMCTGGWADSTAAFAMAFLAENGPGRGEQLREAAALALCALSAECLHPDTAAVLPAPLAAVALPPAPYAAERGVSFASVAASALDSAHGTPSRGVARLVASVAAAPPHARLAEVLLLPGRAAAKKGQLPGAGPSKVENAATQERYGLQVLWEQVQASEADPNCLDSLKAALRGTARSPAVSELLKLSGAAGEMSDEKNTGPIADCLLCSAVSSARTALRVQGEVRHRGPGGPQELPRRSASVKRAASCLMASAAALEAASSVPGSIPSSLAGLLTKTVDRDGLKDLVSAAGGAGVWVDGLPEECAQALQCLALAALQQHVLLLPERRAPAAQRRGSQREFQSLHRGLGVHSGLADALVRVAAPLLAALPESTNVERAAILEAAWSHLQKAPDAVARRSPETKGVGARIEAAGLLTAERARSLRIEGPLLQVALSGGLDAAGGALDGGALAAALGPHLLRRSKDRGLDTEACLSACGALSALRDSCRATARLARALKTVFWMGTAVPKAPRPDAASREALREFGAEALAALQAAAPLARDLATGSVTLHTLDRGLVLPGHVNFAAAVAREMLDLQVLLARVSLASGGALAAVGTGEGEPGVEALAVLPSRAVLLEVCCDWLDSLLGPGGFAGLGPDPSASTVGCKAAAQALDLLLVAFGAADELWRGGGDEVPVGLTHRALGLAFKAVGWGRRCTQPEGASLEETSGAGPGETRGPRPHFLPVAAHALPCARAALAAAVEAGGQVQEWLPMLEQTLLPDGARLHGALRQLLTVPGGSVQGGSLGQMLGAMAAEKLPGAVAGHGPAAGALGSGAVGGEAPEGLSNVVETLSLLLTVARADPSGAALRIGAAFAAEGDFLHVLVRSLKARLVGNGYSGGENRLTRPRLRQESPPSEQKPEAERGDEPVSSKKMRLLDRPQGDRVPGIKPYDAFWRAPESFDGGPPGSLCGTRGPALLLELQQRTSDAVPALPWGLPEGALEGLSPACRAWFLLLELLAVLLDAASQPPGSPSLASPRRGPGSPVELQPEPRIGSRSGLSASEVEHFLVGALLDLRGALAVGGDPERVPGQASLVEVTGMQLKARVLGALGRSLGKWQHSASRAALADLNRTAACVLALAALPALRPRHLLQCTPGSRRERALHARRALPFSTVCGWFGLAALGSSPGRGSAVAGERARAGRSPSPLRHKKLFVRTPERARTLAPMPFSPRSPRSPTGASRQEAMRVLKQASEFSFEFSLQVYESALHALEFLCATVPSGDGEATALVCQGCGLQPEGLRQVVHGIQEQCIGASLDANSALATRRSEAEAGQPTSAEETSATSGASALMGRVLAASARLLELLFDETHDQLQQDSAQQATLNAVYTRFSAATAEASRVGAALGSDLRAARLQAQSCHNLLVQMKNGTVAPQELEALRARMLKVLRLMQEGLDASSPAMGSPAPDGAGFARAGGHGSRTQWQLAQRGLQRLAAVLEQSGAEAAPGPASAAAAAAPVCGNLQ